MKRSVLTRYRVMAFVTAVMLLILCACMVAKYGFDTGADLTFVVSQTHGVLFMIYLVFAFDLSSKPAGPSKMLWVMVSGTIPLAAFFVERKIRAEVEPLVSDAVEPAKA
ncbi:membrane protein [Streptomyces sp. MBRL 10]|nr:membrane protein [Streptomyces sp. MBRL 10]